MDPAVARILHCRDEIAGWQTQEKVILERLSKEQKAELDEATKPAKTSRPPSAPL